MELLEKYEMSCELKIKWLLLSTVLGAIASLFKPQIIFTVQQLPIYTVSSPYHLGSS
jgi:hypothetical protein